MGTDEKSASKAILHLQTCLEDLDRRHAVLQKSLDKLVRPRSEKSTLHTMPLFRQAWLFLRHSAAKRAPPMNSMDVVNAEIRHLEHHLSLLAFQKQEATTEMTRLRASMSACSRFPPEIWSTIFELCLPDEVYIQPNRSSAPLLFCSVCHFWKRVAISTPILWKSLSICRSRRKRPNITLLRQWLQHSKSLPLNLDIALSSTGDSHPDHAVLQMALACSGRWERIRLNIADDILLQKILLSDMPFLQTLEFNSTSVISKLKIDHTFAPKIRTVSFLTAPLDPTPISLPWGQLTHLSSHHWADIHTHLEIMRRCPNLEHTSIHILQAHCSLSFDSPLVMKCMKSLDVVALSGRAMGLILERLMLPAISDLSLVVPEESPEYGSSGWPKDSVVSLVERSSCKTLRVVLQGIDISITDENELVELKT